jgi:hypothetical protein
MKRVFVLSASYGEGHNAAARGLVEAINNQAGGEAAQFLICWRSPFLAGIDGHGEVTRLLLIDFPGFGARSIVGWSALNLFPAIFGCFESRKNCWSNLLWMNVPM